MIDVSPEMAIETQSRTRSLFPTHSDYEEYRHFSMTLPINNRTMHEQQPRRRGLCSAVYQQQVYVLNENNRRR